MTGSHLGVTLTGSAQAFAARAQPWLAVHPVATNIVGTVLAEVLAGRSSYDDASWAVVEDARGAVVGAAMHTAPFGAYVPPLPRGAAAALADAWHAAGRRPPGVNGAVASAEEFAGRWVELTGQAAERFEREGVHVLGTLRPPSVPGRVRAPRADDAALVAAWLDAFAAEALPGAPQVVTLSDVAARLDGGRLVLWEDAAPGPADPPDSGLVPVALAGWRDPAAGVGRVGPVYTPPEHRRRGYAAAVTAEATRRVLDAGARDCMLFTDLANPTSNGVYARLGYEQVGETTRWRFSPPPGGPHHRGPG